MNAYSRQTRPRPNVHSGFTLVEILTVIVIIGILMGIAIPAIVIAINRGRTSKVRLEIGALEQAIEQYQQEYGDYPPDFSSWPVVERHYRKIFPRIGQGELNRLRMLLDVDPGNDRDTTVPSPWPAHDAAAMDRGEVLAWVLGGYSDNPLTPFTGPGGPLEEIDTADTMTVTFQINSDRPNKLHDFEQSRLDILGVNPSATLDVNNRYISSDNDLFPSYAAIDSDSGPFVYFDSRTYAYFSPGNNDFNGYASLTFGVIRPYYSEEAVNNVSGADYPSVAAALAAWRFVKPDTFQIIAPGLDEKFGEFATVTPSSAVPMYFQYPSGSAIAPVIGSNVDTPGELIVPTISGYQEAAHGLSLSTPVRLFENPQLDNITNFSKAQIVDDVEN